MMSVATDAYNVQCLVRSHDVLTNSTCIAPIDILCLYWLTNVLCSYNAYSMMKRIYNTPYHKHMYKVHSVYVTNMKTSLVASSSLQFNNYN